MTKRLAEFNKSFDRSFVNAILNDAMTAPNSLERSLLLAAAELMQHWHHSSNLVQSARDAEIGRFDTPDDLFHPEQLKQRLRSINGLVKVHRALTRKK